MDIIKEITHQWPIIGLLLVVIVALVGFIVKLLVRLDKAQTALTDANEQHSEKYIALLNKTNTQLESTADKRRESDDRYNQVLGGVVAAIKEANPNPQLEEVKRELERLNRNTTLIGTKSGVPINELLAN